MNRLIVVSNRLPFALDSTGEDLWTVTPATGGLVSAIEPVLRERGGVWIGWPGIAGEIPQEPFAKATRNAGYKIVPVALSESERSEFYYGYSNEVIWPLFHDLQNFCNFDPTYWQAYKDVNRRYANAIAHCAQPNDFIWVHDYHLMYVGWALREQSMSRTISGLAFFLHIPFPPYDIFSKLPQQQRLLRALLQFDLLGFQTRRDVRNFIQCVRRVMPDAKIAPRRDLQLIRFEKRQIRVGHFPIGIDFVSFENGAKAETVADKAQQLRSTFPGYQLVLGSDRLDYSKGIPERLRAFRTALELHPELRERIVLIQIVVPSRVEIPRYHEFKDRIDRLVGDINGRFSTSTWLPVQYHFRSLDRDDLLAHYRGCDIAFVTPLKDGMNLVAKEYCACRIEDDGVLILSQFAGAAEQLKPGAVLVNPYDVEQMADAISEAYRMNEAARTSRMKRMRRVVRSENVFWWVDSFLKTAAKLAARSSQVEAATSRVRAISKR
ncbi:MAG TPA: trehalose-6-phosphate synthase [Candidatus Udaeobacter sp.]|jgi:trehalose 6-phosphate synthase|nr:trehalose-6-phosphate synthase [Candidatus Udaeobacter sp.]